VLLQKTSKFKNLGLNVYNGRVVIGVNVTGQMQVFLHDKKYSAEAGACDVLWLPIKGMCHCVDTSSMIRSSSVEVEILKN
jgi:hypothetical protein